MYLTSSDLELITDNTRGDQLVALHFANIRIPRGTRMRKAYLQFTVNEVSTEQTDLTIHAERAGDAVAFTNARRNAPSRKRTSASVKWSPEPWNTVGEHSERQRTPDLAALIQEVIAQPDWQAGNASGLHYQWIGTQGGRVLRRRSDGRAHSLHRAGRKQRPGSRASVRLSRSGAR